MSCDRSPFLLSPAGKDYLWGGERLKTEYGKCPQVSPLAETWECSAHPDGPSIIRSGSKKGMTLAAAIKAEPGILGTHPENREELPILIKFIDAAQDLSVQVHPDDEYALAHEGQLGKTEMWYVLDAAPGASLCCGFAHDMSAAAVRRSVDSGQLLHHLQSVEVHADDVFFIRPGMIHAIGAGTLVVEIQENSNVTYRVYDYGRRDKDGQERELHMEKALAVMNFKKEPEVRQQLRVMRYKPGAATELLCRCRYFQVERVLLGSKYIFAVEINSFQVLLCLSGEVKTGGLCLKRGDCLFIPAGAGLITLTGSGQLLKVGC